jgi:hypothetical protein
MGVTTAAFEVDAALLLAGTLPEFNASMYGDMFV